MPIRARPERVERASPASKRLVAGFAPTLIGLITVAIVLFVGLEVSNTMVETIRAANETVRLAGTTGGSLVNLVAVLPMVMIVAALVSVVGPG